MRDYAAEHDWLTIVQLSSCAPDLNPVKGVRSLLRRGPPASTAFTDDEHLVRSTADDSERAPPSGARGNPTPHAAPQGHVLLEWGFRRRRGGRFRTSRPLMIVVRRA
ncbi:hypothetical protein ACFRFN_00375 [Streptomyces mirabilis]|uniref:hypothetical protein n=1 Tax=Streptomyces mirabilis TaxID=68239 RepID=UPI0036AB7105